MAPSSGERDRDTKPHKYAGAGIPYFWRVEREGDRIVVATYALDHELVGYRPTGTHVNELSIDDPFPVTIDLTRVDRM